MDYNVIKDFDAKKQGIAAYLRIFITLFVVVKLAFRENEALDIYINIRR